MKYFYSLAFAKQLKVLPSDLKEEALEKIELFKNPANHTQLKVHKLHGPLSDCHSFSVNYRTRVVFKYVERKTAVLFTAVGDHEVYK